MIKFSNAHFVFGNFMPYSDTSGYTCNIGVENDYFQVKVTYPEGGSYFTTVPISGEQYRKYHPTQCGFYRHSDYSLDIADDYGRRTNFFCQDAYVIDDLVRELEMWGVPNLKGK